MRAQKWGAQGQPKIHRKNLTIKKGKGRDEGRGGGEGKQFMGSLGQD